MSQTSILKTFLNFLSGGGGLCNFHLMERYNRVQYFLFYCVVFEHGTKHLLFLSLCNLLAHNEASSCLFNCSIFVDKTFNTTLKKCCFTITCFGF
jgi:hypothetical protein